jgi:hypothetical protein
MTKTENDSQYESGYSDMMKLITAAQRWRWPKPTERFLVTEIQWLERSAAMIQHQSSHGLKVLNQTSHSPSWYHGRADAIRQLLRDLHLQEIE